MASASHRRPRPARKRRTALLSAAVVAAVGLVVCLVVALRPGGEPDTVRTAAGPDAGGRPSAGTAPGSAGTAPGKPAPAAKAKPGPSAASPGRTSAPATPSARPSPTTAPRSPARPASGTAAGRIAPGVTYRGVATHYDAADGDGACSFGPSPDLMVAAMSHTDYETSAACGAYLLVRAANGASVTVRVTNECPLPCAPGQLDLSKQAFAKLAGLSTGRIPVSWSLLSPATSDTISIRYKTGSSRHWCGIQALGHRNPLARLEVRTGSGWQRLTRTEYNYFLSPDGTGCGGPLRLTDLHGERLTVEGVTVRPDAVQPTRVQFARVT